MYVCQSLNEAVSLSLSLRAFVRVCLLMSVCVCVRGGGGVEGWRLYAFFCVSVVSECVCLSVERGIKKERQKR